MLACSVPGRGDPSAMRNLRRGLHVGSHASAPLLSAPVNFQDHHAMRSRMPCMSHSALTCGPKSGCIFWLGGPWV